LRCTPLTVPAGDLGPSNTPLGAPDSPIWPPDPLHRSLRQFTHAARPIQLTNAGVPWQNYGPFSTSVMGVHQNVHLAVPLTWLKLAMKWAPLPMGSIAVAYRANRALPFNPASACSAE
jgi:hypothetical protein